MISDQSYTGKGKMVRLMVSRMPGCVESWAERLAQNCQVLNQNLITRNLQRLNQEPRKCRICLQWCCCQLVQSLIQLFLCC